MKILTPFLKRYWEALFFCVLGLVLLLVGLLALTGVTGFVLFFSGAASLILGILFFVY
jgi:hypothetical protein